MYPRPGSNRHAFKGQGILSPSCLPIPPLRHLHKNAFKGQGILSPSCLPIPPLRHLHKKSRLPSGPCGAENETRTRDPDLGKVVLYQLSYFRLASLVGNLFTRFPLTFSAAKVQLFSILQTFLRKIFFLCSFFAVFASNRQTILNDERERN